MIKKDQILQIVEPYLAGSDLFLVKFNIGKDNLINIYIDGDDGVTIDECVKLSRHIEQNLDRESEDFELRVSSPGADEPFVNIRQYKKNIGRPVKITLKDGKTKRGILEGVKEDIITIQEEIKNKNKKSKKMTTGESIQLQTDEITEAKVIIVF
jgi:ribosome maturation factor RimP